MRKENENAKQIKSDNVSKKINTREWKGREEALDKLGWVTEEGVDFAKRKKEEGTVLSLSLLCSTVTRTSEGSISPSHAMHLELPHSANIWWHKKSK